MAGAARHMHQARHVPGQQVVRARRRAFLGIAAIAFAAEPIEHDQRAVMLGGDGAALDAPAAAQHVPALLAQPPGMAVEGLVAASVEDGIHRGESETAALPGRQRRPAREIVKQSVDEHLCARPPKRRSPLCAEERSGEALIPIRGRHVRVIAAARNGQVVRRRTMRRCRGTPHRRRRTPSRPGEDRGPCPRPEAEGTDLRSSGASQAGAASPREAVTPADRIWMRKGSEGFAAARPRSRECHRGRRAIRRRPTAQAWRSCASWGPRSRVNGSPRVVSVAARRSRRAWYAGPSSALSASR